MKKKKPNLLLISLHRKSLLRNFKKTVKRQINHTKLEKQIGKIAYAKNNLGLWGIVDTNDNYKIWKEIKKSDIVIFLYNKKFFARATVVTTKRNSQIPKQIWTDFSFINNRNLLIFLEKVEPIDLNYDACIPVLINPGMSDAYYFAVRKVSEDKLKFLINTFGSIENALDFLGTPKKAKSSISDYLTTKQLFEEVDFTTKLVTNKQRLGQQKFRKNVLHNFYYRCAICKVTDMILLEAAHIVPIEDKKLAGKTNNGICLCSNCHKMFDKGFFSFDNNYNIIVSNKKKISKKMQLFLENRKIGKYRIPPSKDYVNLHRTKFSLV